MRKKTKVLKYTAVFESAEEGGYIVTVPALPGCVTQGETFEEAVEMVKDAIKGYIASLVKHHEPIPQEPEEEFIGVVEVPVLVPA